MCVAEEFLRAGDCIEGAAPAAGLASPARRRLLGLLAGGCAGLALPVRAAASSGPEVYPTRVPPPFSHAYTLRRGLLGGTGEIAWQPQGSAYRLRLEGKVALFGAVLTQVSEGRIDASGLAPLRFIDRRLRRPERSAVFDREAGRISFTGRTTTQPVVPGVQDRLSWMIQLPAIAEADPQRVRAGAVVRLMVVSAKGDAKVWTLRSRGMQQVSLPGGSVEAVNLVRESADPRDTVAEVWLDPQRHHLPVRARMTERDGEPLELLLDA
ncbi:DUF3108 domain-containing protein [Caldimonas thermodepolymerans]|uniref:DUF3108 domain-containing protein n=1 Tax=Caldimonas thermodepolymerans TaxID=215580 RepID=UPI002236AFEC|nr:DUF3108 domain-containing protein [Caldimonas thermodepolymerans]UZG44061.1 DUF3108 domain-containing protein [Caldimonas thermodepolymerans]